MLNEKELKALIHRDYPYIIYRESETGYYILDFIDIENCYVQGETLEEILSIKDKVKENFLKRYYAIFKTLPEPTDLSEASGKLTIRLPKALVSKLKEFAQFEKLSVNQLILYIISNRKADIPWYFNFKNKKEEHNNLLLRIPKTLHKKIKLISKSEGVSINQYLIYKISEYLEGIEKENLEKKTNYFKENIIFSKEHKSNEETYEYKAG